VTDAAPAASAALAKVRQTIRSRPVEGEINTIVLRQPSGGIPVKRELSSSRKI